MRPPQDHTSAFASWPARFEMTPIAIARTPYKERFGTPHQATTTRGTRDGEAGVGTIELLPDIPVEALRGLDGFDYVWVIYVFHMNEGWSALVRPPRGPRTKRGVLATRSPHRPSPIGLSALRIERVEGRVLHVRGLDLLDGTPVLDLKPYVPYADAFPDARAGWVDEVDRLEAAGGSAAPEESADESADESAGQNESEAKGE